jgi:two-component system, OmpR family, response regulator
MAKICKILVVDDHDDVREILGAMVAHAGYRFTLARDAEEARSVIEQEIFDVAIIDATLPPREDGHELAEFAASRGIGIIMISGDPTQRPHLARGRHAYLEKPFRVAEMMALVDKVLQAIDADCEPAPDKRRAAGRD